MSDLSFVDGSIGVLIGYGVCWFWQVRPMRRNVLREVTEMRATLDEIREGHRRMLDDTVAKIDDISAMAARKARA